MKRFVGLAIGAALLAAPQAHGFSGFFKKHSGNGGTAPVVATAMPCPQGPAPVAVAPAVQFVEQQITCYEAVPRTRKVEVVSYKEVRQQVPYEYQVMEQFEVMKKVPVTRQRQVTKEVPYEYQ